MRVTECSWGSRNWKYHSFECKKSRDLVDSSFVSRIAQLR